MSAWKPSTSGRSTASSSLSISRQLCMPAQQISPSAARRSPWSAAIFAASAKVSAMAWVPVSGCSAQSLGGGGGVDADHAVAADTDLPQVAGDAAGLLDLREERLAAGAGVHGAAPAGRLPDGGHHAADHEVAVADVLGELLQVVVRGVDRDVRLEEEQVDPVEPLPVHLRVEGVVEHRLQRDRRVVRVRLFADEAGPGGVVELGERMHRGVLSSPPPKPEPWLRLRRGACQRG